MSFLEKLFDFVPAGGTSDIYVSKITPHISGSPKQFITTLEQVLNENQINGYRRDNRLDYLQKSFHN